SWTTLRTRSPCGTATSTGTSSVSSRWSSEPSGVAAGPQACHRPQDPHKPKEAKYSDRKAIMTFNKKKTVKTLTIFALAVLIAIAGQTARKALAQQNSEAQAP